MLNFKDIFIKNISQEVEANSSLPFIIPITQTVYGDLKTNNGIGTIGNNNFCFSFEFPVDDADAPNIKKYRDVINEFVLLKFSKTELFNDFYIYKIPDYSNQALTPGFLDFIPFVMVGDDTNGYSKILQNHVAILRSYYTKQAYILIDKKASIAGIEPYTTLSTINILFKFKRYYDYKKNINGTINYQLENNETNTILVYDEYRDVFAGNLNIQTSSFTESDLKRISFACDNIKLHNNHIMQNLKLFLVEKNGNSEEIISLDEYANKVERQSAETRDYYHILMNMLYDKDSINKISQKQDHITIRIEINNYLFDSPEEANNAKVNVYLEQDTPPIKSYTNNNLDEVKKAFPNIQHWDQYITVKYILDTDNLELISSFHIIPTASASTQPTTYIEIIPLNYEDRIFVFQISKDQSDAQLLSDDPSKVTLNVHTVLSSGNIYKPCIDLSKANIIVFDSNGKYKDLSSNISNGHISDLANSDTVIITIDKNIPEITKDNTTNTADLTALDDNALHTDAIYKSTIKEDPYLESYTNTLTNLDCNVSNNLSESKEVFAYDTITFDGLDDILTDGEIRINKIDEKYALIGQSYQKSTNDFLNQYSTNAELVKDKITSVYNESIKPVYEAHTSVINTYLDNIKKTFAYIYTNVQGNTPDAIKGVTNGNRQGFLFLALELESDALFDLIIKKNDKDLYYREYNCKPITIAGKHIYIHLPFYLFNTLSSQVIDSSYIPDLTFNIEGNIIGKYYFQK